MRIGFIDCDQKNNSNPFPNLCIMKLSAWHKIQGDITEWYRQFTGEYDKVYVSKVFSFSPDYKYPINAKEVVYGGSGYAISMINGRETYNKELDKPLPYEIEHIYPDYALYGITNTAYGFMSRGCPRGCDFCHVMDMQGRVANKTADLSEFWKDQQNLVLLDPNITACGDWKDIFQQLTDSRVNVNFSQGLDIRLMDNEKISMLKEIKCKNVHFAWDRYEDKDIIVPKLKAFKRITQWDRRRIIVYVLCGNRERRITGHDLDRIYTLRDIGCWPYVMLYDKESLPKGHELKQLQRWVNNRIIWESVATFDEYIIRYTKTG